jgi:hypothetical protein
VFGKIEEVVVFAKFWRHVADVLLGLLILLRGSEKPRTGLGQQPLRHA